MTVSFLPTVFYPAGSSPYGIVTTDFNGDGNTDLAVTDRDNNVGILLGNGDGDIDIAVTDTYSDDMVILISNQPQPMRGILFFR